MNGINKKNIIIYSIVAVFAIILIALVLLLDSPSNRKRKEEYTGNSPASLYSGLMYYYEKNKEYMPWFGGTHSIVKDRRRGDIFDLQIMIKEEFWDDNPENCEWYNFIESLKKPGDVYYLKKCENSYYDLETTYNIMLSDKQLRGLCSGGFMIDEKLSKVKCGCKLTEYHELKRKLGNIVNLDFVEFRIGENFTSANLIINF